MKNIIYFTFMGIVFILGCQKESKSMANQHPSYIAFFDLGDTLYNNNSTIFETSKITIDTTLKYTFTLTSTHNSVPNQSASYFVRIDFDFKDKLKFLSRLASGGAVFEGPLLSTFKYGDTIAIDNTNPLNLDWFPKTEIQANNSGWLKYHIFTSFQGSTTQNIKKGGNYLVFKFGAPGNEKIGWLTVDYQDTWCYVKEGYYIAEANQGIIVGKHE